MNIRQALATVINPFLKDDERLTLVPPLRPSRAPMKSGTVLRKPKRIPSAFKHVLLQSDIQTFEQPKDALDLAGFNVTKDKKTGEESLDPVFACNNTDPVATTVDGIEIFTTGVLETALRWNYDVIIVMDSPDPADQIEWWNSSDIDPTRVFYPGIFKGDHATQLQQALMSVYGDLGLSDALDTMHPLPWKDLLSSLSLFSISSGTRIAERPVQ